MLAPRRARSVWRVGFNAGDRAFWPRSAPATSPIATAPERLAGDPRRRCIADAAASPISCSTAIPAPIHAERRARSRARRGLTVHVFEEGYLRPYWVTYERGGANGHSRLMRMSVDEMRAALADSDAEAPAAPARWGDMREHVFYGALYHWFVLFREPAATAISARTARSTCAAEFRLYLRRLLLMPVHALDRRAGHAAHPAWAAFPITWRCCSLNMTPVFRDAFALRLDDRVPRRA
ncbi:MAG: hypothetical protein U5K36_01600 [Roseovarius sp.]|nr:hypothetical protein [Roseovarius sp.]